MKRALRPFAAVLLALGLLVAAHPSPSSAETFEQRARSFVDTVGAEAIQTFGTPDKAERYAHFREMLTRCFDLPTIGRYVLGQYAARFTPEQMASFMAAFEDYVVANYAAKQWDVKGVRIEIASTAQNNPDDIAVDTLIHIPHKSNKPIAMGWRIYNAGAAPKIIDLKVDGLSLVVSQRAEFGSVLQQKKGDVKEFVAFIQARTRQLDGSAPVSKAAVN